MNMGHGGKTWSLQKRGSKPKEVRHEGIPGDRGRRTHQVYQKTEPRFRSRDGRAADRILRGEEEKQLGQNSIALGGAVYGKGQGKISLRTRRET